MAALTAARYAMASHLYAAALGSRSRWLPTEPKEAIKRQCADTAKVYGLDDRGILAPGYLADINVIELDKIGMSRPWVANDLSWWKAFIAVATATKPPSSQVL